MAGSSNALRALAALQSGMHGRTVDIYLPSAATVYNNHLGPRVSLAAYDLAMIVGTFGRVCTRVIWRPRLPSLPIGGIAVIAGPGDLRS
jgi:hypothetical protein